MTTSSYNPPVSESIAELIDTKQENSVALDCLSPLIQNDLKIHCNWRKSTVSEMEEDVTLSSYHEYHLLSLNKAIKSCIKIE